MPDAEPSPEPLIIPLDPDIEPDTYQTAHAYRLGAFQLVRERLDAFHIQLHNYTDSDWCLCIGSFSVLPLLLRQFQEALTPVSYTHLDVYKRQRFDWFYL